MRWNWVGLFILVLGCAGCASVTIAGSALVHDETGEVIRAVVTNDHTEQPLRRLPGSLLFAVPEVEGTIEVRCGTE